MSKKILITGFGPFPGVDENPCTALIDSLAAYFNGSVNGHHIEFMHLETTYHQGLHSFRAKLSSYQPDLTICFGVHSGADGFRLERVARNQANIAAADAYGYTPILPVLEQQGLAEYVSRLPLDAIQEALDEAHIDNHINEDAGSYLCNASFYYLMHYLETKNPNGLGGFIHIPQAEHKELFQAATTIIKAATRNLTLLCK